jgi:hypothetical protein
MGIRHIAFVVEDIERARGHANENCILDAKGKSDERLYER